jgi:hypothetical protein
MQGFLTQTAATLASSGTKGLPDNGLFLATESTNELGFDVQLAYRNSDNGNNAWRYLRQGSGATVSTGEGTIANPVGGPNPKTFSLLSGQNAQYDKLYVYAVSTRGSSAIKVTLNYDDSSSSVLNNLLLPDSAVEPGSSLWPSNYESVTGQEIADVIDDMTRLNGISGTGAFTATATGRAIFALGFDVDQTKVLTGFTVEYLGEVDAVDGTTGALTIHSETTSTSGISIYGASAMAVAEPSTCVLIGIGVIGLAFARKRKMM